MNVGSVPTDPAAAIDRTRFPVDEWKLIERRYDEIDLGRTETLFSVANGYLGMRGNMEEGRDSYESGTFINGFHETWRIHHAEQAYGFAQTGQTIINVPDAKPIRLYVDDEPLNLPDADLPEYERTLDFKNGVLTRELIWRTPSGKRVQVRSSRMVSFTERHLAILKFEVTLLDADAPVAVSCQLLNRQDGQDEYGHAKVGSPTPGIPDPRKVEAISARVLQPREYWQDGGRSVLSYRVTNSEMTIAVAADHEIETDNPYIVRTRIEPDIAKNVYRVDAKQGVPITVTKVVSYHTSRHVPTRELIDRCRRTLDRVEEGGIAEQFDRQRAWLDDFWARSGVDIGGHPDLQQAVRWNLFQLAQATMRSDGMGVPAKGETGSGYSGHYFWDTEIYVLPFLTYTSPQVSRNALRFRHSMLEASRRRARELNERGALFPWRTINGEEASAYYAAGTAQYHIDADVTYALAKYLSATGDSDFVAREGVDIAVETARMWSTLGFWRDSGDHAFHIHGVTGPDEYTTVVNDNLFTNVMARFNLRFAASLVRQLERTDPERYDLMRDRLSLDPTEVIEWEQAAEAMAIPFSEALNIHPQDSHFLEREVWDLAHTPPEKRPLLLYYHPLVIYRFQVLKQADVVLALYLQGDQFTASEKLADFDYYDPITTGDSTLSSVVQAIIAAEVGYSRLALRYFMSALYVDLADLHHNTADGVHIASTGGVWSALIGGFAGMRDYEGVISFDPRLPATWPDLTFRLTLHSARARIRIEQTSMTVTLETGDVFPFEVRGQHYLATPDAPITVPLADQGRRLVGAPSQRDLEDNRRDDGTLITASIPIISHDVQQPE